MNKQDALCRCCLRFNRTFMELKYLLQTHSSLLRVRFNRTFMELKYEPFERINATGLSFNRTFMELKFA